MISVISRTDILPPPLPEDKNLGPQPTHPLWEEDWEEWGMAILTMLHLNSYHQEVLLYLLNSYMNTRMNARCCGSYREGHLHTSVSKPLPSSTDRHPFQLNWYITSSRKRSPPTRPCNTPSPHHTHTPHRAWSIPLACSVLPPSLCPSCQLESAVRPPGPRFPPL